MADQVDVAVATVKKNKIVKKAATDSNDKLTYSAMVTKAITNLKEKKGSSRHAIMQYISAEYKVDPASGKSLMNRALAKMAKSGRLVPGAQAGRSGAGSYKLSAEEKIAIKKREKVEAKKQAGAVKKVNKKIAGEVTAVKKKVAKKSAGMKKVVAKKSGGKAKKGAKAKVGAKVKSGEKATMGELMTEMTGLVMEGKAIIGAKAKVGAKVKSGEEATMGGLMTEMTGLVMEGKAIIGAKAKKKLSAKPKKVAKKAVVKMSKK